MKIRPQRVVFVIVVVFSVDGKNMFLYICLETHNYKITTVVFYSWQNSSDIQHRDEIKNEGSQYDRGSAVLEMD